MGIILNSSDPIELSNLKKTGKTLVLAGGCFDILHAGHIEFLKKARELGDELIVLLEPDEKIKKLKGENRPVNTQKDRAIVLSHLPSVSYVLQLTNVQNDSDYEILVKMLKPDIIATSGSDYVFDWEKELEKQGLFKISRVMDRVPNKSTTQLVKDLK